MKSMRSLLFKVTGYIAIRYLIFLTLLYITKEDVKIVRPSELQKGEDWFMFVWLFALPVFIEFLIIGIPFWHGLNRLANSSKNIFVYILFVILFLIEFFIANWLYGSESAFIKVATSSVLFLIFFRKRIFYIKRKT